MARIQWHAWPHITVLYSSGNKNMAVLSAGRPKPAGRKADSIATESRAVAAATAGVGVEVGVGAGIGVELELEEEVKEEEEEEE